MLAEAMPEHRISVAPAAAAAAAAAASRLVSRPIEAVRAAAALIAAAAPTQQRARRLGGRRPFYESLRPSKLQAILWLLEFRIFHHERYGYAPTQRRARRLGQTRRPTALRVPLVTACQAPTGEQASDAQRHSPRPGWQGPFEPRHSRFDPEMQALPAEFRPGIAGGIPTGAGPGSADAVKVCTAGDPSLSHIPLIAAARSGPVRAGASF